MNNFLIEIVCLEKNLSCLVATSGHYIASRRSDEIIQIEFVSKQAIIIIIFSAFIHVDAEFDRFHVTGNEKLTTKIIIVIT